jgi:hypothetical protein
MPVHPKDHASHNPRMQCTVCKRWMRMNSWITEASGRREQFQRFCACGYGNGDHLAGDGVEVCQDCCQTKCRELAEAKAA